MKGASSNGVMFFIGAGAFGTRHLAGTLGTTIPNIPLAFVHTRDEQYQFRRH